MECNKEEAIRAMDVAEKKMADKDFVGARKMAMRAQQLYPDLLNFSQLILVCDVHCASVRKVYGNEIDWYGVLQIEPTADEAAIKKQFRKLALSLHPDKNKFAGASDAFKMIGEAQKVLLDPEKRILYDSKCKAAGRYQSNWPSHHGSRQTNVRGHPWFQNTFVSSATSQFANQLHQQKQQQTQSEHVDTRPTFWTICPFCSVKYQYYRDLLNKTLNCQTCKKNFTGYEMNPPGGIPRTNSSQPAFPQHTGAVNKGNSTSVPQSTSKNSPKTANQGNVNIKNLNRNSFSEKRFTPVVTGESNGNENHESKKHNVDSSKKFRNSKRNVRKRKLSAESSESCDSESSIDSEEDMIIEEDGDNLLRKNFGSHSDQNLRRSARSKQRVIYDENLSGDDDVPKRSKYSGSFHAGVEVGEGSSVKKEASLAAEMLENKNKVKQKEASSSDKSPRNRDNKSEKTCENMAVSEDDERSSEPRDYECPDPEFSDFEKDRKEECFAVGQMWAVYDTLDAMPRFYALIRKVLGPGFRLRITWLEPGPEDEDKMKWVNEGLPASCGRFICGRSEVSEQLAMFSHRVYWEKSSKRENFKIYPRTGETWALFKGWDKNWHSDPLRKNHYDYEFVEVLSEYADNSGVRVAFLGKLKGFACLFGRILKDGIDSFLIPANDIYRFSHKVPSFRMSGEERVNVPQGSFELDPGSLPASYVGIDVFTTLSMDAGQMHCNGSCSGSHKDTHEPRENSQEDASPAQFVELKLGSQETVAATGLEEPILESGRNEASVDKVELKAKSEWTSFEGEAEKKDLPNYNGNGSESFTNEIEDSSTPASEAYEIPEPEFYNFDADKSMEKFQVGQIWAVYSDEDALPKYYGRIRKIDSPPRFALHLTWLVAASPSKDLIHWNDKKMPICCGKFKLAKGKPKLFDSCGPFSHQLRVVQDEKNVYNIFPEKGDIWALYKHWSPRMTCSDLEICEYDVVEVLDKNDAGITVLVLELVNGFKSVFKPQIEGQSTVNRQIPWAELLRFSHQVPAFRLTEEKDGSLRGFWELDPAALPVHFFFPS